MTNQENKSKLAEVMLREAKALRAEAKKTGNKEQLIAAREIWNTACKLESEA